jgi:glycosyltransferase involved in cell wall biosynthesis
MRILHLDSGRDWRGGQQQLLYLLDYLGESGRATAAVCRAGSPLPDRLLAEGIPFHPWLAAGEGPARSIARLEKAVAAFRPDLIHCHDARSILPGLWVGRRRRKIVIAHRRVDFPVGRLAVLLKYRPLDAVIAVSQRIKDILSAAGLSAAKTFVVPDGIDLARFASVADPGRARARLGIPGTAFHVGSAGSLVDHKGHIYLLEAAARLIPAFPDLYFSIAGEGPLRRLLERRISELGLGKRFRLPGFTADMPAYFHSLDVYAHPSKLEGLGSAVIEAMACGRPVVAAASGGIPEIVLGHGILVPPQDPEALAGGLETLLRSPQDRASLAAHSLERAREFEYHATNSVLSAIYERLTAG